MEKDSPLFWGNCFSGKGPSVPFWPLPLAPVPQPSTAVLALTVYPRQGATSRGPSESPGRLYFWGLKRDLRVTPRCPMSTTHPTKLSPGPPLGLSHLSTDPSGKVSIRTPSWAGNALEEVEEAENERMGLGGGVDH